MSNGRGDAYKAALKTICAYPRHHFLLRTSHVDASSISEIDLALSRLILYSPHAIVVGQREGDLNVLGGMYVDSSRESTTSHSATFRLLQSRAQGIPRILFLPDRDEETFSDYMESDHADAQYSTTHFSFDEEYDDQHGLAVSLKTLSDSPCIWQSLNTGSSDASTLTMLLPDLRNVPPPELARLRDDEGDAFERFHGVMTEFFSRKSTEVSSETQMKELLQYVHDGTRDFGARMQILSSRASLKRYEAAFGATAMGLCFAVPSDVARIILSVIGAYSTRDFVKELFSLRDERAAMKLSPFYVPWKCTRLPRFQQDGAAG